MHDRAIERSLKQIEAALGKLSPDGDSVDPDAILDVLSREAPRLESLLASLMASATDLNTIAAEALRAVLGSVPVPVISKSSLGAHLPAIALTQPELRGILTRCLKLALDRVGAGGEITLETRRDGERVRAFVGAQPGDHPTAGVLPFEAQSLSLTDMLDDLGVKHQFVEAPGALAMEMCFATAVA